MPTAVTWAATSVRARSRAIQSPAPSTTGVGAATANAPRSPMHAAFHRLPKLAPGPPSNKTDCSSSGMTPKAIRLRPKSPYRTVKTPDHEMDRLGMEVNRHRHQLSRNRRQRRGHGALLLRALFVSHLLQERLRGACRHPGAERYHRDDIVTWTDPDVPKLVSNFSVAAYHGPSFMIDDLVYQYETFKVDSVLINCHYPVSPNKFVLMYGFTVKKTDDLPAGIADQTVDAMIDTSVSVRAGQSRSGRTRPASTIRCSAPRTVRYTN